MTKRGQEVLRDALALSTRDRARVAAELIVSVEGPADQDVEKAWALEIEKRARRVQAGEAKTTDWEVLRRKLLRRRPR